MSDLRSRRRFEEFKPQELSNTAWAFARAGVADEALFMRLGDVALRKLRGFNPQNLTNTIWAFATAGFKHQAVFEGVAAASLPQLEGFNAQNLSNSIWAFARSELYPPTSVRPRDTFLRTRRGGAAAARRGIDRGDAAAWDGSWRTPRPRRGIEIVDIPRGRVGDAAVPRRRRGRDVDNPWRRVAATPRGETWIFRGGGTG